MASSCCTTLRASQATDGRTASGSSSFNDSPLALTIDTTGPPARALLLRRTPRRARVVVAADNDWHNLPTLLRSRRADAQCGPHRQPGAAHSIVGSVRPIPECQRGDSGGSAPHRSARGRGRGQARGLALRGGDWNRRDQGRCVHRVSGARSFAELPERAIW